MKKQRSESTELGVIVGPTRYMEPSTGEVKHTLDLFDLDRHGLLGAPAEPDRIALEFFAHGFTTNPARPWQAALFEKRGPGGACVDLATLRVLAPIAPLAGHAFYGHGAFTQDGARLLAVEMNLATRDGVITIRDAADFSVIDQFPSFGAAPHDCHLIEDGAVLAITNGGGALADSRRLPSVTFVDVASHKLLERCEVDNPRINAGHIATLPGREFALVSAPRDGIAETSVGGISLRRGKSALKQMREPKHITERMVGESLSVAIHGPSRAVLATHPYGHLATLWDLDSGQISAAGDLQSARGVTLTLDGRYFAVSAGAQAGLLLFTASPFALVAGRDPGRGRFGGSHIYAWRRCAAA